MADEEIDRVDHLELEGWQRGEIEAGIADVDAGRVVCHEEVLAWLQTWETGTGDSTPTPQMDESRDGRL